MRLRRNSCLTSLQLSSGVRLHPNPHNYEGAALYCPCSRLRTCPRTRAHRCPRTHDNSRRCNFRHRCWQRRRVLRSGTPYRGANRRQLTSLQPNASRLLRRARDRCALAIQGSRCRLLSESARGMFGLISGVVGADGDWWPHRPTHSSDRGTPRSWRRSIHRRWHASWG